MLPLRQDVAKLLESLPGYFDLVFIYLIMSSIWTVFGVINYSGLEDDNAEFRNILSYKDYVLF